MKIIQIVWHWLNKTPACQTSRLVGITENTVGDWFNFCREVCVISNEGRWRQIKIGDGVGRNRLSDLPATVVQADESLLRGRRKYNRGRLLAGDERLPEGNRQEARNIEENLGIQIPDERNFGARIDGPWVVGLASCELDPATGK